MGGPDRDDDLLALASKRLDFLERLADDALEKREMVEALGHSRSTVNRAVAELADAGLVRATDDGHVTTLTGRLTAEMYRRVSDEARDVRATTDVLAPLPSESPIGLELVAGADIERTDGPPPYRSLERLRDAIRDADGVRAVVPTLSNLETLRVCRSRVVEDGMPVEVVTSRELFERVANRFPGVLRHLALGADCSVSTADVPAFTTLLVETDGRTAVTVVVYTDDNAIHGVVENDRPAAVRWAESLYGRVRTRATDRTDELEAFGGGRDGGIPSDEGRREAAGSTGRTARPPETETQSRSESRGQTQSQSETQSQSRSQSETQNQSERGHESASEDGDRGRRENRTRSEGGSPAPGEPASGATSEPGTESSAGSTPGSRSSRIDVRPDPSVLAVEANGFVRLSREYFERREPQPPAVCWRTGLDLVEVHAGYAIDREFTRDGRRENLTDHLVNRLRQGTDQVVVGPPGSGKSTACKAVACRWYENDYGPVFYRESGRGDAFDSRPALGRRLRQVDGQALVVIEDAVRAEANEVFTLMAEFGGSSTVTFLLDAREEEWQQPDEFPIDAGLEAYRRETVETVVMPRLDRTECRRLVRRFEDTVGATVESRVEELLEGIERESETTAEGASPGRMLLLLHRLSSYADPLASYDSRTPTTLAEDVQRTYELLRESEDELALDVGVTVALLNACGVGVYPDLVHALAADGGHDAVRDALSTLEGRVLFGADRTDGDAGRYRSIHESWSRLFLEHLLTATPEREARRRFGRCVSALLSLADDARLRERIDWEFEGEATYVNEITVAPDEWADEFLRRVFTLGREYPGIAPLFGKSEYSHIELPAACSAEAPIRCTEWRGEMYRRAGQYDRATREFERLADLANEADVLDAERTSAKVALSLTKRGEIEMHRGDLEEADASLTRGLERYRDLGDERGAAASLLRLGVLAWTRGDVPTAEERISRSLDTYRDLGDRRGESECLGNLAVIAIRAGDLESAREYATRSLEVRRALGARLGEADSLRLLGRIAFERGAFETAEERANRSFEIARDVGAGRTEANALMLLGEISRERGATAEATEYLERSLEIWQDLGVDHGRADCLRTLGNVAREQGSLDEAEDALRRSLELVREVGDRREEAETLVDLGELARETGDPGLARERFETASEVYRDVGAERDALHTLERLVDVCESSGETERAVQHCEAAVDLARRVGLADERTTFETTLDRLSEEVAR
jgi:tetratricopeptide (TPR) repeat protein/predicted transcriptional regulator